MGPTRRLVGAPHLGASIGYAPPVSDIIARLSENPIILAVIIFLIGGLVYGLMKKVLQLALIFVLGFVALGGWFVYTGQEPPDAMKRIADGARESVKKGAEVGKEKAREVGEKLGEEIGKAAKKTLEEGLSAGSATEED